MDDCRLISTGFWILASWTVMGLQANGAGHPSPAPATDHPSPPPAPASVPSAALAPGANAPVLAPPDETQALHEIEDSLHENAFDIVNLRANTFLKKFPNSALKADVHMAQGKALYQMGLDQQALDALNISANPIRDDLVVPISFWQGEVLLDLNKWSDAEQKFRAVLGSKSDLHREGAKLGLAWALFSQSKDAEANQLLGELTATGANTPATQQAQLILGKLALSRNDYSGASTHLAALVASEPEPRVAYQANYWLGEAQIAGGQYAEATKSLERITADDRAFPKRLVARANLALGQAQKALGHDELAMTSFQAAYKLTEDPETRFEGFTSFLSSSIASNKLQDAVSQLQDFAKQVPDSAPDALFANASALAGTQMDDGKAITIFESFIIAYGKSPRAPVAEHLLAQLYLRTGNLPEAQKAFQACIDLGPDPSIQRDCNFQLGIAAFQSGDWSGAVDHFTKVASQGTDSVSEEASYNVILSQAHLKHIDLVTQGAAKFLHDFPKSAYASPIATTEGDLLSSLGRNDEARAAYRKGLVPDATDSGQRLLLKHFADFLYQTGSVDEAQDVWQAIVNRFPDDSIEASERGLQAMYESQKISDAQYIVALQQLALKYAGSPAAGEINFRLGEFYFYQTDWVKAQTTLQQVATSYPDSPFSGDACFFAGQAAAAHQDLTSAQTFFSSVPASCSFAQEAKIWLAQTYHDQLKFQAAVDAYQAVIDSEKSGPRFVEANLGLGQCWFDLAKDDAANYTKAISAYSAILASNDGTPAQRNQAGLMEGHCLEKMGKETEALALYLDVIYDRLSVPPHDSTSAPPPPSVSAKPSATPISTDVSVTTQPPQPANTIPPELKWQILAGWDAGRIREGQKDWRSAIEIYQRMEEIGGSDRQAFHDLVNKIRRDNYIFD